MTFGISKPTANTPNSAGWENYKRRTEMVQALKAQGVPADEARRIAWETKEA